MHKCIKTDKERNQQDQVPETQISVKVSPISKRNQCTDAVKERKEQSRLQAIPIEEIDSSKPALKHNLKQVSGNY